MRSHPELLNLMLALHGTTWGMHLPCWWAASPWLRLAHMPAASFLQVAL